MFSAPGDGYSRFPQACFAGIKKTDKETDKEDELRKRMKKTGNSLIEEDRKPGYNPDDWAFVSRVMEERKVCWRDVISGRRGT